MKTRNLLLAMIGSALTLAGCVAVPAYEPTYAPPRAAVYVAPPAVVVQPYLYAHWGHYYRGPYYPHR